MWCRVAASHREAGSRNGATPTEVDTEVDMFSSQMFYDMARQQQAEEVARAEQWRRRPRRAARRRHLPAAGLHLAEASRRRLARLTAALAGGVVPRH